MYIFVIIFVTINYEIVCILSDDPTGPIDN